VRRHRADTVIYCAGQKNGVTLLQKQAEFLIGIATTVVAKIRPSGSGGVQKPPRYFRRMAAVASRSGQRVALFTPADVEWSKGTVRAWVPVASDRPNGAWKKQTTNLPDVIYENIFVHLAIQGYSRQLRLEAARRGIPVFNPPLPGKWRLHRYLEQTELSRYLPKTEVLSDVKRALGRIDTWKMTYVKPIGGYGGVGVSRVQALGRDRYRVSWDRTSSGTTARSRREMTSRELLRWLKGKMNVPHLVQQGLNLMTVNGRKVDFRVVTQRDSNGTWQLVGIVPKVAAVDGVVTNLVAGGERRTLEQLIQAARSEGGVIPVRKLEQCALEISRRVTAGHPRMGLAGFDLGVDEGGRVWMIEMNPKPARSLLDDEMRLASARYSAEFAGFLARQRRR